MTLFRIHFDYQNDFFLKTHWSSRKYIEFRFEQINVFMTHQFRNLLYFRTFTTEPCETVHTLKTRKILYQPEPDYWMAMVM